MSKFNISIALYSGPAVLWKLSAKQAGDANPALHHHIRFKPRYLGTRLGRQFLLPPKKRAGPRSGSGFNAASCDEGRLSRDGKRVTCKLAAPNTEGVNPLGLLYLKQPLDASVRLCACYTLGATLSFSPLLSLAKQCAP